VQTGAYNSEFNPVALPGETLHIIKSDGKLDVVVRAITALPEYIKNFGALTANTWLTTQQDTNLEMTSMELGQYRFRVQFDGRVKLYNPSSIKLWRTAKTDFWIGKYPIESGEDFLKQYVWRASEFFVFEDEYPAFDLWSLTTTTTAYVLFSGWRLKLEEITEPGRIPLWVNSWPSGG